MSREEIPDSLKRFIGDHIDSVEALEILLLLKNEPERFWSAEEISVRLRSNVRAIEIRLLRLHREGLLRIQDIDRNLKFRYDPKDEALHKQVTELAEAYLVRRFSIISVIYSGVSEGVQSFADAFRLGGRKE